MTQKSAAFSIAAAIALAASHAAGAVPLPDVEWRKIETKFTTVAQPRQILSPGVFDRSIQHVITFPPNGAPVDIGLPHGGKDKNGNPRPPFMARYAQDFVWIDFDNDGKPGPGETCRINPDGWSDPFMCDLFYDDGTTSKYAFRLRTVVDKEKYALIRACAHTFDYNGKIVSILDDDGNGKYNDNGKDAIMVEGQPACFIGKHVLIGDALVELIVHTSGVTVEVRPASKEVETGLFEPFDKYEPPQRGENIKIHTVVFAGPEGSFAVDDTHRTLKMPAGVYDMVFGLFEREKEVMYMKKGEKTSFTVTANLKNQIKWGGKVKATFKMETDGQDVTVGPPHFLGQMSEEYVPENTKVTNCVARIQMVFKDRTHFDIDSYIPFGSKRYDLFPNGDFKPIIFKSYRTVNDEYEGLVEYTSGIIGRVEGKEHLSFVYKKREKEKKPAN